MSDNMPTISEIKRSARSAIFKSAPRCIGAGLLFIVIDLLVSKLSLHVSGVGAWMTEVSARLFEYSEMIGTGTTGYTLRTDDISFFSMFVPAGAVLSILLSILMSVFATSLSWFFLRVLRNENPPNSALFQGFSYFSRVFVLNILMSIFVMLWSFLLIVPGIIASLRYSQAAFLMYDNPEMKPLECIRESKKLMHGYKTELFILGLSFFGWYILGAVITHYTGYDLMRVWLLPYTVFASAVFYNSLIGYQPPVVAD